MALKALMLDGVDPVEKAEREEKERLEKAARNRALSTTLRQVMNHYLEHKRTKHGTSEIPLLRCVFYCIDTRRACIVRAF
jgi:hypothetical protein